MASIEDTIDLDFAEDELLGDELSSEQKVEHTETTSVSAKLIKSNHDEEQSEQQIRKSRRRHARVRYYSPPTSESDGRSRSTSIQRNDSNSHLSESDSRKREKRLANARRFGIDPVPQTVDVDENEVEELYRSMDVRVRSSRHRLHSVYVRGVDGLSTFQIKKMFAEFDPVAVEMIDKVSCNVIWDDRFAVAKMMLEMTKPLKRIRSSRQVEEGEVADSGEEEDGEMREEQGDDVTISTVKGSSSNKRNAEANVIEVDVDQVEVPPGKWRVITKHVGHKRLIILRFSLREDIAKGRRTFVEAERKSTSDSVDPDGYSYKWMNRKNRVRPGLNIFDEKGNELDWDYEHDTRFYEEPGRTADEQASSPTPVDDGVIVLGSAKRKIKTRGRGAKRFKTVSDMLSDTGSLTADREDFDRSKRKFSRTIFGGAANDDDDDSDLSCDRDPSPTPQPWDLKKTSVHLRVSKMKSDRK